MTETTPPAESRKYEVSIEYCVPCDYSAHAFRVADELLGHYQHIIDKLVINTESMPFLVEIGWSPVWLSRPTVLNV